MLAFASPEVQINADIDQGSANGIRFVERNGRLSLHVPNSVTQDQLREFSSVASHAFGNRSSAAHGYTRRGLGTLGNVTLIGGHVAKVVASRAARAAVCGLCEWDPIERRIDSINHGLQRGLSGIDTPDGVYFAPRDLDPHIPEHRMELHQLEKSGFASKHGSLSDVLGPHYDDFCSSVFRGLEGVVSERGGRLSGFGKSTNEGKGISIELPSDLEPTIWVPLLNDRIELTRAMFERSLAYQSTIRPYESLDGLSHELREQFPSFDELFAGNSLEI